VSPYVIEIGSHNREKLERLRAIAANEVIFPWLDKQHIQSRHWHLDSLNHDGTFTVDGQEQLGRVLVTVLNGVLVAPAEYP